MKISNNLSFSYPVLMDGRDDYFGDFEFRVDLSLREKKSGHVEIDYSTILDEEGITGLLNSGNAETGLFIVCKDTHYSRLHTLPGTDGKLSIKAGALRGRVTIRPLIFLSKDLENYTNDNFHSEYQESVINLRKGSIIAADNEYSTFIGREKLAPTETIFTFAKKDDVPRGEFQVDLDDEKITILAESETYELVNRMRGLSEYEALLFNGIYLPVVMEVLSALENSGTQYEKHQWYNIFLANCHKQGIDPHQQNEILVCAQKLMKRPFSKVLKKLGKTND